MTQFTVGFEQNPDGSIRFTLEMPTKQPTSTPAEIDFAGIAVEMFRSWASKTMPATLRANIVTIREDDFPRSKKIVAEEFAGFLSHFYKDSKDTLPKNQHDQLETAFFGGACALLGKLMQESDNEEQGFDYLTNVNLELKNFFLNRPR